MNCEWVWYTLSSSLLPVTLIFPAFKTITYAPLSTCGAKSTLSLPRRMTATFVASLPNVWPSASITYHFLSVLTI
ncbi:MAG: hypothetical protein ACD_3C00134G0001, partial [uncultured bacterium (gcode 4)]